MAYSGCGVWWATHSTKRGSSAYSSTPDHVPGPRNLSGIIRVRRMVDNVSAQTRILGIFLDSLIMRASTIERLQAAHSCSEPVLFTWLRRQIIESNCVRSPPIFPQPQTRPRKRPPLDPPKPQAASAILSPGKALREFCRHFLLAGCYESSTLPSAQKNAAKLMRAFPAPMQL